MYLLDFENVVNMVWKDNEILLLLTRQVKIEDNTQKMTVFEYNTVTHEKKEIYQFDSTNIILGTGYEEIVLCRWANLKRNSPNEVATKISISNLASINEVSEYDLFFTAKVESCEKGVLKLTEATPDLLPFIKYYDLEQKQYVESVVSEVDFQGDEDTIIYANGNQIAVLETPNIFIEVVVTTNKVNFVLLRDDRKVLFYHKP
jgi:hypothetical protein